MLFHKSYFESFTNKTKTTFNKLYQQESSRKESSRNQVKSFSFSLYVTFHPFIPMIIFLVLLFYRPLVSKVTISCLIRLSTSCFRARGGYAPEEVVSVTAPDAGGVRSFCGSSNILDYPYLPSSFLLFPRVFPRGSSMFCFNPL
jgi:hypothetical protein